MFVHILTRHTENRDIHQSIPDHRVRLTPLGWTQAHAAGQRLRSLLLPTDTLQFFTSPYTRTRETTQGILSTLTSDDPEPSPFPLRNIKVYEEPRLREQDFGNFQPCSAEMERMWQERADYGHFFYRIPNGESAADAYDRVSGFNESLWRQFGEDDCASVCVLVTHGLMSRVFLMKWYHFSVEYFEDLRNVEHCEFLIMRKEESGKYNLETKLRTWSGLKRERALALKEKSEQDQAEGNVPKCLTKPLLELRTGPRPGDLPPILPPSTSIPKMKQWGGCPNGCDHGRFRYKKENSVHSMTTNGAVSSSLIESPPIRRHFKASHFRPSSDEDTDHPREQPQDEEEAQIEPTVKDREKEEKKEKPLLGNITQGIDKLMLGGDPSHKETLQGPTYTTRSGQKSKSQRATPAAETGYLNPGRDFGGTTSGYTSAIEGETETDAEIDAAMANKIQKYMFRQKMREKREKGGGMGRGAKADALGDQDEATVECDHPIHKMEGHDKFDAMDGKNDPDVVDMGAKIGNDDEIDPSSESQAKRIIRQGGERVEEEGENGHGLEATQSGTKEVGDRVESMGELREVSTKEESSEDVERGRCEKSVEGQVR